MEDRWALGVLTGESIEITDRAQGEWAFPTEEFAIWIDDYRFRDAVKQHVPLSTKAVLPHRFRVPYEGVLDQPLELQLDTIIIGEMPIQLEMAVGNEEINGWLDKKDFSEYNFGHSQRASETYNRLAERLGLPQKKILPDADFRDKRRARWKEGQPRE